MKKNILCCDWGTTSFRLRLVDISNYEVIAEQQTAEGIGSTFKAWQTELAADRFDFYAAKLRSAIKDLAEASGIDTGNIPVILSGMASSTIGMEEIDYALLPFPVNGSRASSRIYKNFNGEGSSLTLISGIKSADDVMRGEEAQLIGLYALGEFAAEHHPEPLFVFPGTHSKHIQVKDGEMIEFKTYMTGEIYNILTEHSILKDSVTKEGSLSDPDNIAAFTAGVASSGSSNMLNTLFTVRTNQLFSKFTKSQNSFYLSGLVIGTELRSLLDLSYSQLVICSGLHLFQHYKLAAGALDFREIPTFIEPALIDKATIAGQIQLFKALNNIYE